MRMFRVAAYHWHRVVGPMLCVFCLSAALYHSPRLGAAESRLPQPPAAPEVEELVRTKPLNAESWPAWRDFFVRLYYAYDTRVPKQFYDRIGEYLDGLRRQNGGTLPGLLANDPVAWIARAQYLSDLKPLPVNQVIDASRRALAAGDPGAMSSYNLALNLLASTPTQPTLGRAPRGSLDEVERLLKTVEQRAPLARLSYHYGLMAIARGDDSMGVALMRQAAYDFPGRSAPAAAYLSLWLRSQQSRAPYANETTPFVGRFPDDAAIAAFHAVALYRDKRFPEAYAFLAKARQGDEQAVQELGSDMIKAIEDARWSTPAMTRGLQYLTSGSYAEAETELRSQLSADPQNVQAARLLAMTLVAAQSSTSRTLPNRRQQPVEECENLCAQFPADPTLQLVRARALHFARRNIESVQAMARAKELGGDPEKYFTPRTFAEIQEAASDEEARQFAAHGLITVVLGAASWLALMFLLGVLLAICIPRAPDPRVTATALRSAREVWLERFYLLVLSVSLLVFYLTVPAVSLALLAITMVLFIAMFFLRIVHIGILQRGFFASWGVIRSVFLGRFRVVQGIAVDEKSQPRLIGVLREVADKLETSPVDAAYLTPTAQICVYEMGSGPFGLFRRRRVMEIGIPAFSQLTQSEFESVIAHEYGHFTHRDAFYTQFISQVTGLLTYSMDVMNAAGGVLTYVNPFYWFYWFYLRAYTLLAAGFSRSREFLADRRAVVAFGKDAFVSGFTKMSVDGGLYQRTVFGNIRRELSQF